MKKDNEHLHLEIEVTDDGGNVKLYVESDGESVPITSFQDVSEKDKQILSALMLQIETMMYESNPYNSTEPINEYKS